jgi:ketosteroid isomerase-like protein
MMSTWFEEYLAAWDSRDISRVADWVTDDIAFEDVGAGHKATGRQAFARFAAASFKAVPHARFDFVAGAEFGDAYFIEWVMQPMALRGVSVGRRRDGKIAENRDYWNSAQYRIGD